MFEGDRALGRPGHGDRLSAARRSAARSPEARISAPPRRRRRRFRSTPETIRRATLRRERRTARTATAARRVMRPASTSCAPSHRTKTTLQKASETATAIRIARVAAHCARPRRRLRPRARSAPCSPVSAPNACMVLTAPRLSAAKAVASASVSWAWRERRRTTRAEAISGAAITGMATMTSADSFGLVKTISAVEPTNMKRLRNAMRGRRAEGGLDLRRVGGQARDELADARAVVERGVEPGQMGEDVAPQVRHHPLAERRDEIVADRRGERDDQDHRAHGEEIGVDDAGRCPPRSRNRSSGAGRKEPPASRPRIWSAPPAPQARGPNSAGHSAKAAASARKDALLVAGSVMAPSINAFSRRKSRLPLRPRSSRFTRSRSAEPSSACGVHSTSVTSSSSHWTGPGLSPAADSASSGVLPSRPSRRAARHRAVSPWGRR